MNVFLQFRNENLSVKATLNIDFASRDGSKIHQNAFRPCDGNFVLITTEIEPTKHGDSQIELCKQSLDLS